MTLGFVLGRRPALDGVRAIAIITVVGFHVFHSVYTSGIYPFAGGFIGVDLFFVLSGFLITALLLEEWQVTGRISLRSFYYRRVLRLFPAQALLLLGVILASLGVFAMSGDLSIFRESGQAVGAVFFYASNWVLAFGWWDLGPLGPMWSLSIEEQFYLIWPLAIGAALRSGAGPRTILVAMLSLAASSAVWRGVLYHRTGSVDRVYYGLDTHADFLLLGCALALWFNVRGEPTSTRARKLLHLASGLSAMLLMAVLCFVEYGDSVMFYGVYSAVALAAVAVVAQAVIGFPDWIAGALQNPLMLWIGRLSYGMYLWHYLVLYVIVKSGIVGGLGLSDFSTALALLVLVAGGTAVAASFSYYTIERRFLARKPRRPEVAGEPGRPIARF